MPNQLKQEFFHVGYKQDVYRQICADKDLLLKRELLENTKIKEPITKGKLKWHGIKLCATARGQNTFSSTWWEQRGKTIGKIIVQKINIL